MPELPEVETLVRAIAPRLAGRRIARVRVLDSRVLEQPASTFRRRVTGRRIERVWRRGKWVIVELDRGTSLLIQLRMTGQVRLVPPEGTNHVRLVLELSDRTRCWYCDTRCLGHVAALDREALSARLSEAHQGPEALEITLRQLSNRLRDSQRNVKTLLLDQRVVSGVGNLYADEILHAARLHPERKARTLSLAERRRLHRAIGGVLQTAIAHRGSTLRDGRYQTADGQDGEFQTRHRVYGREGQPCVRCGTPVARKRIRGLIGRSSYFCPACQPAGKESPKTGRRNLASKTSAKC